MGRYPAVMAFLHSREGRGWVAILVFAALLASAAGYGFYDLSLRAFIANKTDEKTTALELVEAFVNNYSDLRDDLNGAGAPVPAIFGAHSIALFNQTRSSGNSLRMRWIGRAGRAIATPPSDPQMAATIESFVGRAQPEPVSQIITVNGEEVFRTVYPTIAREQSCVDCHNQLQPGLHWQLNEVMGAFSLDVPVAAFLRELRLESVAIGLIVFMLAGSTGLVISLSHYYRIGERETARQRAETANRAKSSFLATMSHELRTPLNAIIGFSEMMLYEVVGEFRNEHYRSYTEDIHNSGAHLLRIINDILDLSKVESGKLDLSDEVFDIHDIFRSLHNLAGERLRAAGLTAKLDLPPDLPRLHGDEVKTRQVLLNLLTNAAKFTPAGGTVEASSVVDEHGLSITIADTGIGIAAQDIERVFRAFEQVDSSMTREHEGTGLGLPLARAFMELQGGSLTLSSTPGVGTRVTITFPPTRLVYPADTLRPAA